MPSEKIKNIPTLYVLCDARAACLRMAADSVRIKISSGSIHNGYKTKYVWARHKNIGEQLFNTSKVCKSNDEILIVVPQLDPNQRDQVVDAIKAMMGKKITINWYFGPEWFDDDQSVCKTLTKVVEELKGFKRTEPGTSPHQIITFDNNEKPAPTINFKVNSFYDFVDPEDEGQVKRIRDVENFIEYQLMHVFMGNYTAESAFESIITALTAAKKESLFKIPKEIGVSAERMKELVDYYSSTKPSMAGRSAMFEELKEHIVVLARSKSPNSSVLIVGETGTGKEATAYFLHEFSDRRVNKFRTLNCSHFSDDLFSSEMFGYVKGSHNVAHAKHEGLVSKAEGGTIFLDELHTTTLSVQSKLLRFMETGKYRPVGSDGDDETANVRIIAAVQPGSLENLKEDLYYRFKGRVNTFSLCHLNREYLQNGRATFGLPDIISISMNLASAAIGESKPQKGPIAKGSETKPEKVAHKDVADFWKRIVLQENVDLLTSYNWPGNVRILQKFILLHLCEDISLIKALEQIKKETFTKELDSYPYSLPAVPPESALTAVADVHVLETPAISGSMFAHIKSKEEFIPFHELKNKYAKHIRESGVTNNRNKKELEELADQVGLTWNPFNEYVMGNYVKDGIKGIRLWSKQVKSETSANIIPKKTKSAQKDAKKSR